MSTSVELKNAMLHLYESMTSGDVSAVEHLFSRQSSVTAIGTDPNEWWTDYETIVRVHFIRKMENGKLYSIMSQ